MKYLKIQNDGILDIRLVALMGGTTKANDRHKIGQFGTGLKYTLAFLFRNNLDFKIFAGTQQVRIDLEKEEIRDEVFEIICINGHRSSITTKMGEDWTAWMIIRELWCNALDEGGAVKEITDQLEGAEGKTTFFIQADRQVQDVVNKWSRYFIHEQEPIWKGNDCALYPAGDHLCIYKGGVLVYENREKKGVFSYDVSFLEINELREYRSSPSYAVVCALHNCNENAARYFLENVTESHYEGEMDYNWYQSFGQAWRNVIGSAKIIHPEVLKEIKDRGNTPDESTLLVIPKQLFHFLSKQFDGISALRVASKLSDFYEAHNEQTEGKVKQALTILEACGYVIHPELQFVYGFFEDNMVLAKVVMDTKKIMVSNTMLQRPLFDIITMIVEENEHYNTGMDDHTRAFQQHFIDLYTRQLLAGSEIEI
ncbi:hypothetical protein [Deminuibacter soli]|uniref:Uncharacterized protein n=1 Tax=Deminuibacter soli TaxID=2291815 RepID=A0A3E1NQ34_9BACT|nr:hypothetical protein [Deminuibacter soli]RFM30059.1 hypothetical protein DXN05_03545 [Deminuibacter soli]